MKKTLKILKDLKKNNNRDWFQANKVRFDESQLEFKSFVDQVTHELSTHDQIDTGKTKIFRIYRDVRFSHDKTPYNLHRSSSFFRSGEDRRGGYYLRIQPGRSCIVGGFFGPDPKDMLHIRKQIQQEPNTLRRIIEEKEISEYFDGLTGERVKSAPRGFDKNDPAIELLRYKQLLLLHNFMDAEVLHPDFSKHVVEGFKKMRPFLDYMSEILTTDLNGESLLDH